MSWMMQAKKADGAMSTPQSIFHRNIRNHSTPLIGNGGNSSRHSSNSNKKKGRKRKLVDSNVIDLTPKKYRLSSNDSDIEIIEPEPPAIIDLVADETNNCTAFTAVNATADADILAIADIMAIENILATEDTTATVGPIATVDTMVTADTAPTVDTSSTSDSQQSENKSSDTTVNVIIDSADCIDLAETSNEPQKVIEPLNQPNLEPEPLYVVCRDSSRNDPIKPPLYDIVSDDSFCFDSPLPSQEFPRFDSTFATPTSSRNTSQNKTLTNSVDDSVIFVSETIRTPKRFQRTEEFIPINNRGRSNQTLKRIPRADDYIPINKGGCANKKQQKKKSQWSPKTTQTITSKPITATQTSSAPTIPKTISGVKRMILIDGNNVAFGHSRNRHFSVEGIDICLNYFLEKGYDTKAIVPQMRLKKARSTNQDLLAKLETEGKVVFSPCKNLPNGQKITSYDDRFILDFAADYDAAVISNDNYRDLSKESDKYQDIINTRVIGFTFLNDIIRFPQDPYGKFGPSLNDILNGKEE